MQLTLYRFSDSGESTIGHLSINGVHETFTLEDTYHNPKIYGETRIPAGTYKILLNNCDDSRMVQEYRAHANGDVRKVFRGHLWLQDVPDYTYIYIHIGNDKRDTNGCILVGDNCINNVVESGEIYSSTVAWLRIYPMIADAIDKEEVTITIIDGDRNAKK